MLNKQGIIKRMLMSAGARMVKSAGGASFDSVSAGWLLQNGYFRAYELLSGGMPAWSGETVSRETALNHSVVWACNKIISESIGFIPALLMREEKDGDVNPARKHPMYLAMKNAPNEEITAQTFSETLTSHTVMQGNGFSFIRRRSGTGTAVAMDMLLPENVGVGRDSLKRLCYVIHENGAADKTYTVIPGKPHDMLHIRGLGWDGLVGYSV
ncbi:MAG: phage portal protein, partial [Planctomycetaceae bacterium]